MYGRYQAPTCVTFREISPHTVKLHHMCVIMVMMFWKNTNTNVKFCRLCFIFFLFLHINVLVVCLDVTNVNILKGMQVTTNATGLQNMQILIRIAHGCTSESVVSQHAFEICRSRFFDHVHECLRPRLHSDQDCSYECSWSKKI